MSTSSMAHASNRRILIVDDNAAIHQDFRKILGASAGSAASSTSAAESALFDDEPDAKVPATEPVGEPLDFALDSAMQGQAALERVVSARKEGLPYAMAFLDVRMPPGWDGVETAKRLWEVEPDLQIVICTAFSDYSWQETVAALGRTDRLLILKKPFDRVEVCQLASALTEKWNVTQRERQSLQTAVRAEMEARAYAASLETTHRALETSWAQAERELGRRREFLLDLATYVLAPAQAHLVERTDAARLESDGHDATARFERLLDPTLAIVSAIASTLELAAIDADRAQSKWSSCDPTSLVDELCATAAASASARGVQVEVLHSSGVPERIETDPARLRRVLDELLTNALRHSSHGKVRVRLEPDPDVPSSLRFSVSDDGEGLCDAALSHLFEPFNPAATGAEHPRAGLGLAVCKRTAALLRARLNGENRAEGGARFTLTLPLRADTSRR